MSLRAGRPAGAWGARIAASWYRPHLTWFALALTPLSVLYATAAAVRRTLYRWRLLPSTTMPVPVIVIGNIAVGGTGKTPTVLALAAALQARGFHPGVVSRGYGRERVDISGGRRRPSSGRVVSPHDSAREVGDEPLLMARRGWPVAVARHRAAAARALLESDPACDVIIADDGLQHHALARDLEIAVIDGARGFGNRWLLPAGPLREPVRRLREVDAVVVNGPSEGTESRLNPHTFALCILPVAFVSVADARRTRPADAFAGTRAHAVAGIGHPERFFATLRALRIDAVTRSYPDHYAWRPEDLPAEAEVVLMTEKDAVKCAGFADERCWFLRVNGELDARLVELVTVRLHELARSRPAAAASASSSTPH